MKSDITGRVSINIDAPVTKVWDALTTPSIIKKYFFGTNAISDWRKGSPLIFKGEWEGKQYVDKGIIFETIPDELFKYSYWSSISGIEEKPENYAVITYELAPKNDGTRLTIIQENIPDEKMKKHSEENWKKVIGALKELLEKEPVHAE